jgi:hypothetical protein
LLLPAEPGLPVLPALPCVPATPVWLLPADPDVPAVPVVEPESDGRQPTYVAVMNISPRDRRRTRFILKFLRTDQVFERRISRHITANAPATSHKSDDVTYTQLRKVKGHNKVRKIGT